MLENYIPQIAFAMSAIIAVFASDLFFTGDKNFVRTFLSGRHISSKMQGFIAFILNAIILIPLIAFFLQKFIENSLVQNQQNLIVILLVFLGLCFLYYNHKYYKK